MIIPHFDVSIHGRGSEYPRPRLITFHRARCKKIDQRNRRKRGERYDVELLHVTRHHFKARYKKKARRDATGEKEDPLVGEREREREGAFIFSEEEM